MILIFPLAVPVLVLPDLQEELLGRETTGFVRLV
jgi:hypothetical protein